MGKAPHILDLGNNFMQYLYNEYVTLVKSSRDAKYVQRKSGISDHDLDLIIGWAPGHHDPYEESPAFGTCLALMSALQDLKDKPLTRSQLLELRRYLQDAATRVAQIEHDMDDDSDEDASDKSTATKDSAKGMYSREFCSAALNGVIPSDKGNVFEELQDPMIAHYKLTHQSIESRPHQNSSNGVMQKLVQLGTVIKDIGKFSLSEVKRIFLVTDEQFEVKAQQDQQRTSDKLFNELCKKAGLDPANINLNNVAVLRYSSKDKDSNKNPKSEE